jgi:hypothetical protein
MKALFAIILAIVSVSASAWDSRTVYDYQSGNTYNIRQDRGDTRIQGYNYGNGTTWNQTQRQDGTYSGYDSRGNFYQGDNRTGSHISSDGTVCIGTGYARTCTK